MRVAGVVLLIGGCLLCVWIVWAAAGFVMMGFGLICLQIAERNKVRSVQMPPVYFDEIDPYWEQRPVPEQRQPQSAGSKAFRDERADSQREPRVIPRRGGAQSAGSTAALALRNEPRLPPSPFVEPAAAPVLSERQNDRRENATDRYPYDKERWRALVENDADISRAVAVLGPFGETYVAELAMAYLVLNDKEYLPMILQKIAAAVKRDLRRDVATSAATARHPDADSIRPAPVRTRGLASERTYDPQAVPDARTDKLVVASNIPQTGLDAIQAPGAVQPVAETFAGRPEEPASSTAQQRGVEASDARTGVGTPAITYVPRQAMVPVADDAQDLMELLNRIDSGRSLKVER